MERKIKKQKNIRFLISILVVASFFAFQATSIGEGATDTDQITLQLTVNQTIDLNCGTDPVNIGSLTPGTPVFNSTTCTADTNAISGYDLQVKRDDADTTMDLTTDATANITDKTAWDPTAGAGAGNAATWAGTGLGFGVYASTATKSTTWWGTGTACDDVLNKYAGFPTAYATIMDHDTYSGSATTTSVCYKVDTAATQRSGSYDGTITYQAVSKP